MGYSNKRGHSIMTKGRIKTLPGTSWKEWRARLREALRVQGVTPEWLGEMVGYKLPSSMRQVVNGYQGVSREVYDRILRAVPAMRNVAEPPIWCDKQRPGALGPHKPHNYPRGTHRRVMVESSGPLETEVQALICHAHTIRRGQALVRSSIQGLFQSIGVLDESSPVFERLLDQLTSERQVPFARALIRAVRSRRESVETPAIRRLLAHLSKFPEGQTIRGISEATGIRRSRVSSFLSVLQQAGKVCRIKWGVWKTSLDLEGPLYVNGGIRKEVLQALQVLQECDSFTASVLQAVLKRKGGSGSLSSTLRSLRARGVLDQVSEGQWKVNPDRLEILVH